MASVSGDIGLTVVSDRDVSRNPMSFSFPLALFLPLSLFVQLKVHAREENTGMGHHFKTGKLSMRPQKRQN